MIEALQAVIALGLLNVWLLRSSKATEFRGGDARSLREEFAAYGLPVWFFYLVGALKIGSAIALLVGLAVPAIVPWASALVVALMFGAAAMHAKVGDPIKRWLPALAMLAMSGALTALTLPQEL